MGSLCTKSDQDNEIPKSPTHIEEKKAEEIPQEDGEVNMRPENITDTSADGMLTSPVVSEKINDEDIQKKCDGVSTDPRNSTITSLDANLALKTLKTYAIQICLDYGMLLEFEKIMNNSSAHCKELHTQWFILLISLNYPYLLC